MFKKSLLAVAAASMLTLTACGGTAGAGSAAGNSGDDKITMGFAQVGAESGWRTANTKSVQDSAKKAGIDLKFSDAQQKQENQIKAIRSYIQQKVDVIAFSPVVESGWDTVLKEAKDAEDPGHPHRPGGRLLGQVPLQDVPRLRLRGGRQEGRRMAC